MSAAAPQGVAPGVRQPIAGISSMAMRDVLIELSAAYARQGGTPVSVIAAGGVDVARRVGSGEPFDFVVLAADAIAQLEQGGHVVAGSGMDLARSGVAIAVAAGARRPDIRDGSAVRDAVLRARSIGYSTGPSGVYITRLLAQWGIADVVASRTVRAPPGVAVGTLVARGDVELGFQQLSELIHEPGVDVVGRLPPDIQMVTVFCAALCKTSRRHGAVRALLLYFAAPDADDVLRRHGMEPARAEVTSRRHAGS